MIARLLGVLIVCFFVAVAQADIITGIIIKQRPSGAYEITTVGNREVGPGRKIIGYRVRYVRKTPEEIKLARAAGVIQGEQE